MRAELTPQQQQTLPDTQLVTGFPEALWTLISNKKFSQVHWSLVWVKLHEMQLFLPVQKGTNKRPAIHQAWSSEKPQGFPGDFRKPWVSPSSDCTLHKPPETPEKVQDQHSHMACSTDRARALPAGSCTLRVTQLSLFGFTASRGGATALPKPKLSTGVPNTPADR